MKDSQGRERPMWLDDDNEGGPPGGYDAIRVVKVYANYDWLQMPVIYKKEPSWFGLLVEPVLEIFALILYVLGVGRWKRM